MALQFRRGTDSDRLTITPTAGEPIWTTDTEKLYVGDGSTAGGIAVGNDSAEINVIIQNKLGNVSGNIVPDTDSAYDIGSPTNKFRDLYLSGNSIYLGDNLILRNDAGTLVAEDSSATPVSISLSNNTTSDLAEGTNLYYTTARADSDAKNAISASGDLTYNSATGAFSVTTYKSADFNTDLGTKTTADLTEGSNLYFTNARADARVTATADSAYVQARQIKYTNADFADSSFVTTQINNLIDGAPGTLDTLNEIAAALNDDDSAYSTLVGLINAKSDFDSANAIALIDSAYVQARQVNPVSAFTTISVSGQSDVVADNSEAGIDWVNSSSQQQKLTASDAQANDRFGYGLNISQDGNTSIVGAPWESTQKGAAYIHTRSGSTWTQQQKLTASDGAAGDYFGIGMDLSSDGTYALVGSYLAGTSGTGQAYVFTESGGTWSQQAILTASDAAADDQFGYSVALSNDATIAVIGAPEEDTNGTTAGAAYIFTRSGSTWTQQQKIQSTDIQAGDGFGYNVDISNDGNYIAIGAWREDTSGSNAGAVYVFTESGGTWSQQAKIQASDASAGQQFGMAVDLNSDGTTLAVGSADDANNTNGAAAYIFTRSGSTWSQQAKISDPTGVNYDQFGTNIVISDNGNIAAIGAPGEDIDGSSAGGTYIFTRTGTTWSLAKRLVTSDIAASDENGFAIAISGDGTTVITGSYGDDDGGSESGSAYVFIAPAGTSLNDKLTLEAGSGITITTNASTDTIAIAAESSLDSAEAIALIDSAYVQARQITYDFLDSSEAIALIDSAYVQARQSAGTDSAAVIALIDSSYVQARQVNPVSAFTTISVSGQSDVVADNSEAGLSSPYTPTQQAKLEADTPANLDLLGHTAAISNDGNIAVVGAVRDDTTATDAGATFVYTRSGSTWTRAAKLLDSTGSSNDYFGYPDVDISGDGGTIAILNNVGEAFIFTGSGSSWTQQTKITTGHAGVCSCSLSVDGNIFVVGNGPGQGGNSKLYTRSGSTWSTATTLQRGDAVEFSNDGSYLIIGDQGTGSDTGTAYILTGSGSSWTSQATLNASDAAASDKFGEAVAIDNDGDTVIIGASNDGSNTTGAAYVFTRSGSTWSQQQKLTASDAASTYDFGFDVDITADGNTVIIGSPGRNSEAGAYYVFERSGSTWSETNIFVSTDIQAGDQFGHEVTFSSDGTTALVGAVTEDGSGGSARGAAYIFTAPTGTSLSDKLTLEAGSGITITTNASTDTITIAADSSIDSAGTIALIDSAYVQARQITYDFLDSSEAIALIDSAYVQARQSAGTDSAAVIALIDSAYVQVRQVNPVSAFTTISVSGQSDVVADNSEGGASWSTSTETGDLEPNDSVASQRMGYSTDISDDGLYVVAGSPWNSGPGATQAGRAFIHYYNGSSWSVQQRLDPPGGDVVSYLNYGWAVAIDADGNTAAVSARNSNTNGRVYVYTRSGTSWTLQQTLAPTKSNGYFGISVDISEDGNMITVGHQDAVVGSGPKRTGAVEIFTRSGSTWSSVQLIEENNNDFVTDAKIGWSNELASEAKDRVVFGAYTDKSAWVWVNSGGWSRESELTPSNTPSTQNDSYGFAVSINADGTVAAVSDPGADGESSEAKAGNVYIFTRSGSTWTQQQRLYSASQAAGDFFGHGLNLSGDGTRVFIGVSRQDVSPTAEGEVQIWKNTGGTWALESTVNSSDTASNENNRYASKNQSVAVTKDAAYLAVGAYSQSPGGAVYVYTAAVGTSLNDKLTLEAGSGITITTNATTDTITITGSAAGLDSAGTIALIDSAYIQARQTTYTNADFADSAYVTTQINSVIDAAPGALDTLNELAAALGDDANFSTTITNQIAGKLDSAQTTALIDSAYVQARQTTGTDSAATISLIQANSVDSAEVINLIDSAYVAARTTAGTDSAAIINLIDSAYVQERQVYSSDILLQIDSDLTTTDSAQIVHSFNKSTYRTVKYTAQLENDDTSSYHAEEILLTHDGTNIAISSYSKLTLDSDLGEFDAQITGNNVELTLTPTNANTHVKLRAIAMSEGAANSNGLIIAVDSDLTTTDSAQTIHTFDKTNFRTMKYVAQLAVASSGDYHAQEILLTHNGTNVAMTGYAKILLDSDLGTFDALINGNNVELKLSPTKANTNVKLRAIRTLA